jgi:hypothetical protein
MKSAILMVAVGMVAGGHAMADNSSADINQLSGIGHTATIEQVDAPNSQAHIEQFGDHNVAGMAVPQDGGGWVIQGAGISQQMTSNAFALLSQQGSRNQGSILQFHATNATAFLVQGPLCDPECNLLESNDNTAVIQQFDFDNFSRIHQVGSFNFAGTLQDGDGGLMNTADILQVGARNSAGITQFGAGHLGVIRQR